MVVKDVMFMVNGVLIKMANTGGKGSDLRVRIKGGT